jgi:hypothetical protein
VFERLTYRLTSWAGRYGDAAPAACCGVCKPCVTTAAAGLVAGAAGLTAQAVSERRSGGEPAEASALARDEQRSAARPGPSYR